MVKKQNRPTRVFTEGNRRNEGVLKQFKDNSTQALTLIEVLIVISVLFVLMVVFLLARPRATCCRINCMNNLKQIGLSFRTWAMDNKDQFPMQIGVTNGGTMELVNGGNVFPHFLVMSNELSTPKVLVCPEEKEGARQMANTFTMPANSAGAIPLTNDNNVSYFVGVDADESQPTVLLAGDRNLTFNGQAARHGLRLIWTNTVVAWSNIRPRHDNGGNICLSDGSVQSISTPQWPQFLFNTGQPTNRLALP